MQPIHQSVCRNCYTLPFGFKHFMWIQFIKSQKRVIYLYLHGYNLNLVGTWISKSSIALMTLILTILIFAYAQNTIQNWVPALTGCSLSVLDSIGSSGTGSSSFCSNTEQCNLRLDILTLLGWYNSLMFGLPRSTGRSHNSKYTQDLLLWITLSH